MSAKSEDIARTEKPKQSLSAKQLLIVTVVFIVLTFIFDGALGGLFFFAALLFGLLALASYMRERKAQPK